MTIAKLLRSQYVLLLQKAHCGTGEALIYLKNGWEMWVGKLIEKNVEWGKKVCFSELVTSGSP